MSQKRLGFLLVGIGAGFVPPGLILIGSGVNTPLTHMFPILAGLCLGTGLILIYKK